jgi:hypothetical protein
MSVALKLAGIAALLVLAGLVAIDVATAPTPRTGQCLLVRRTVLPDVCVNSCTEPFDCTRTTRPYAVFFTQAATCLDAVICQ